MSAAEEGLATTVPDLAATNGATPAKAKQHGPSPEALMPVRRVDNAHEFPMHSTPKRLAPILTPIKPTASTASSAAGPEPRVSRPAKHAHQRRSSGAASGLAASDTHPEDEIQPAEDLSGHEDSVSTMSEPVGPGSVVHLHILMPTAGAASGPEVFTFTYEEFLGMTIEDLMAHVSLFLPNRHRGAPLDLEVGERGSAGGFGDVLAGQSSGVADNVHSELERRLMLASAAEGAARTGEVGARAAGGAKPKEGKVKKAGLFGRAKGKARVADAREAAAPGGPKDVQWLRARPGAKLSRIPALQERLLKMKLKHGA
ncbi:unnamed protein product [Pedinophyceae sp. YPF-701]|nr:unnamed protein product [Pedinophyceae sp. YPF-701]